MTTTNVYANPAEVACFGATLAQVEEALAPEADMIGWSMLLLCMMSDAQEMVARGMSEDARQLLNRCKWVVTNKVAKRDADGRLL